MVFQRGFSVSDATLLLHCACYCVDGSSSIIPEALMDFLAIVPQSSQRINSIVLLLELDR